MNLECEGSVIYLTWFSVLMIVIKQRELRYVYECVFMQHRSKYRMSLKHVIFV